MVNRHEKSRPMLAHGSGGLSVSALGDEALSITKDGITILDKLQEEIEGNFQPKKEDTLLLADVYSEMELLARGLRVADCGTYLEYQVSETEKKLHKANFCRDRLCPMCNWRRSLKIFSQASKIMDKLEKDGYRFLFLTLTVRSCPAEDLPDTVSALFDGWRYLYNKNRVFRGTVCGTFRSFEITRNKKTGSFHPHLHNVLAVRPDYFHRSYIKQSDWSDMWGHACALSYRPVVDIRTVKPDVSGGFAGSAAEIAKYAVKSVDYLSGHMDEKLIYVSAFLSALSRRKLVSLTGCFRKAGKLLNLDDVETGDLVHVDDDTIREDIATMIVRYGWCNGLYVRLD